MDKPSDRPTSSTVEIGHVVSATKLVAVVVTYNGGDFICRCLSELTSVKEIDQIIVVDNASRDSTVDIVSERYKSVVLLKLSQNIGFGKANNIGILRAVEQGASHVLLVNQDAYVGSAAVRELMKTAAESPTIGILSPLQLGPLPNSLDRKFASYLGRSCATNTLLSDALLGPEMLDAYDVPFVNAAVWLVPAKTFRSVGLFNPAFDHYGEDVDYASRTLARGLRIVVVVNAKITHDRSQQILETTGARWNLLLRAELLRVLLRTDKSSMLNVFSALRTVVGVAISSKEKFLPKAKIVFQLLLFLFARVPNCLDNRSIAIKESEPFFSHTLQNRKRFLLTAQEDL